MADQKSDGAPEPPGAIRLWAPTPATPMGLIWTYIILFTAGAFVGVLGFVAAESFLVRALAAMAVASAVLGVVLYLRAVLLRR